MKPKFLDAFSIRAWLLLAMKLALFWQELFGRQEAVHEARE
jgi:hypothetical protein